MKREDKKELKKFIKKLRNLDKKAMKKWGLRVQLHQTRMPTYEKEKSVQKDIVFNPQTIDLRNFSCDHILYENRWVSDEARINIVSKSNLKRFINC